MTNQLTFQNTHFNVIERNNKLFISAVELASALGYKNSNSISRIYARNKDEFSNAMTEEVKLTLSGNLTKSVRIFSLRGAHLIAMFSRSTIGKEFRKWVLDVLDKETSPQKNDYLQPHPKRRTRILTMLEMDSVVSVTPVPDDAMVFAPSDIPSIVREPGFFKVKDLLEIANAVNEQLRLICK